MSSGKTGVIGITTIAKEDRLIFAISQEAVDWWGCGFDSAQPAGGDRSPSPERSRRAAFISAQPAGVIEHRALSEAEGRGILG